MGSDSNNKTFTKTIANWMKTDKNITIKVQSYADPVFLALRLLDGFNS
jgi:hypothetical protein